MEKQFEIFPSFKVQGTSVTLARSKLTGLQVALVSADGPMCNLYATVATEAITKQGIYHCDDGLPHTLEHLIFLGSKKYPYKGILDKLANRCLAQGTNAWTDVDSTAYTVTTAGSEAFLNILPIYLDHVLNPTITDEGFVTEIHHVNEKGEDKGVVYCEMQGRENSDGDIVERACLSALYPHDSCGYKSETGGKMSNLRKLSVDQVRRYHAEYYRPSNLLLLVTGSMRLEDLLKVVGKFDQGYDHDKKNATAATTQLQQGGAGGGERPWSTPVDPMPAPPAWVGPPDWVPPPEDEDDDEDEEDNDNDDEEGEEEEEEEEEKGEAGDQGGSSGEDDKKGASPKEGGGGEAAARATGQQPVSLKHPGVSLARRTFPAQDESVGTVVLAWRTHQFPPPPPSSNGGGGGGGASSSSSSVGRSTHLDVLLRYLSESAASPLQKAFVESPASAFASDVFFSTETFKCGYAQIWFEGVEADRLEDVLPLFLHTLNTALELPGAATDNTDSDSSGSSGGGGIEMERMAGVIAKKRRRYLSAMEDSPEDMLVTPLIKHFLYHADGELPHEQVASLEGATDVLSHLAECGAWSAEQWRKFALDQFLERPMVCVLAKPSADMVKELEQATAAAEEQTRKELGQEKLAQLAETVAKAQAENNKPIPEATLRSVPLPSTQGIPFFPIHSFRASSSAAASSAHVVAALGEGGGDVDVAVGGGGGSSHDDQQPSKELLATLQASVDAAAAAAAAFSSLPFAVQVDQVESDFLRLELALDTNCLTPRERLWLPLLDEVFFKLPTRDFLGPDEGTGPAPAAAAAASSLFPLQGAGDDGFLSADASVCALEKELVSYSSAVGFGGSTFSPGSFGQHFRIAFKVERGELGLAVAWLRRVLFGTKLEASKLKAGCQSLLASIPEWKRSARSMASAGLSEMVAARSSNASAMSPLRQQQFLKATLSRLKGEKASCEGGGAGPAVAELQAVRGKLLAPLLARLASADAAAAAAAAAAAPRLRVAGDFASAATGQAALGATLFATLAGIVPPSVMAEAPPAAAAAAAAGGAPPPTGALAAAAAAAAATPGGGHKSPANNSLAPPPPPPPPFAWSGAHRNAQGLRPSGRTLVLGLASIENSHVLAAAPGLSWGHPDEAALAVAMEYLEALEGEFWVQIRGAGLAYGAGLFLSREQGLVYFTLSRCADPFKAYSAAAAIVHAYVPPPGTSSSSPSSKNQNQNQNNNPPGGAPKALAAVELENAKSSLCSATLGVWENKSGALSDSFKAWWFLGQGVNAAGEGAPSPSSSSSAAATAATYRRRFMALVEAVTEDDVRRAMATYIAPLFDRTAHVLSVASPASEHVKVAREFGMKGPLACVFSLEGEEAANRVIAVPEEDLDALFPLSAGTGASSSTTTSSSSSSSSASSGSDPAEEGEGEEAGDARWPLGRQPVWRTHRKTVAGAALAAAVGVAGLGVVFAIKAIRGRR